MKKSLLGLSVAVLAFLCGVFITNIFRVAPKPVFAPVVEKIQVEEIKTDEIPFFKVGQLEESEIVEASENIDSQNIYGWYSLRDSKKIPEVNGFILESGKYNDDGTESEKINSSAMVFTELGKDIDEGIVSSVWSEIKGNQVKFKTGKIKGIEYRFEGAFYKNKTSGEEGEELLRGNLQKFVKGKKVAEISGNFAYYEPHCWH